MDPNGNFNPIYEFLRAAFPLQNNDNGGNDVAQAGGDHQAAGSQAPQRQHTDIQMDHADDDEMPDLQEVSDSSDSEGESESDRDAEEVEMQAVDDDDMPPLVPLASSATDPPLPPSPGRINRNRRARVEDDEDEERDRRHPSQRIGNPSGSSTPQTTPQAHASSPTPASDPRPTPHVQHHIFHVNMSARGGAPNNDPLRFFQHMMPTGGNNATPANNTNNAAPPPQMQQPQQPQQNSGRPPPPPPPLFGGVAVSFELGPGLPLPPLNGDPNAQAPNQPQLPNHLAELFTRIGMQVVGAGAANFGFGLGMDSEKEDPERARKLVDGLEEVPVGLVRRLERVGGTGGGMGEDETKGGDGGCAICWDRLVDADGEGFGVQETEKEEEGSESKQPRIVSLPCAHVFHADCLVPWFSRPKQTTCPTCRFNIDPDNLTYVSWRRRQRERQQAEAAAAGAAQGANPGPVADGEPAAVANPNPNSDANANATTPAPNVNLHPAPGTADVQQQIMDGEVTVDQLINWFENNHPMNPIDGIVNLLNNPNNAATPPPAAAATGGGGAGTPPNHDHPAPANVNANANANATAPLQLPRYATDFLASVQNLIIPVPIVVPVGGPNAGAGGAAASTNGNGPATTPAATPANANANANPNAPGTPGPQQGQPQQPPRPQTLNELYASMLFPLRRQGQGQSPNAPPPTALNVPLNFPLPLFHVDGRPYQPPQAAANADANANANVNANNATTTAAGLAPAPAPGPANSNVAPGTPNANQQPAAQGPANPANLPGFTLPMGLLPPNGRHDVVRVTMDMFFDGLGPFGPLPLPVPQAAGPAPGGQPPVADAARPQGEEPEMATEEDILMMMEEDEEDEQLRALEDDVWGMLAGTHAAAVANANNINDANAINDAINNTLNNGNGNGNAPNHHRQAQPQQPAGAGTHAAAVANANAINDAINNALNNGNGNGNVPDHYRQPQPQQPAGAQQVPPAAGQRGPPLPGGMFNMGNGFHIAAGSGRTVSEAFSQLFAGMQARPQQAQPGQASEQDAAQPQNQAGAAQPQQQGEAPVPAPGTQPQAQPQAPFVTGAPGIFNLNMAPNPMRMFPQFADMFGGGGAARYEQPERPKRAWTLPPAPGPTLRQRIERREREAGLRCYDVSCGLGPSDEDPLGTELGDAAAASGMKQLSIRHQGAEEGNVCEHTFHSACLVSAERVALKGADAIVEDGTVEVSCPVCRSVGCVTKEEWDEGVVALE